MEDQTHELLRQAYHVDSEYKTPSFIEPREFFGDYPQILNAILQIVTIARAGGMTEERHIEIGQEILAAYGNLRGEAFYPLRDGLIQILLSDDLDSESESNSGKAPKFGGQN